jgi:hypothetical protein
MKYEIAIVINIDTETEVSTMAMDVNDPSCPAYMVSKALNEIAQSTSEAMKASLWEKHPLLEGLPPADQHRLIQAFTWGEFDKAEADAAEEGVPNG